MTFFVKISIYIKNFDPFMILYKFKMVIVFITKFKKIIIPNIYATNINENYIYPKMFNSADEQDKNEISIFENIDVKTFFNTYTKKEQKNIFEKIRVLDFSKPRNYTWRTVNYKFLRNLLFEKNIPLPISKLLSNVEEIDISNNKNKILSKDFLKFPLKHTKKLKLNKLNINSKDLKFIYYRCKNLKSLELEENQNMDFFAIKKFYYLSNVEELNISGCNLKNNQVQLITSKMKLRSLNASNNKELSFENINLDKSIDSLEELDISGTVIRTETFEYIKRFNKLKILKISKDYYSDYYSDNSESYINILFNENFPNLEVLDISNQDITLDSFLSIPKLKLLKTLKMSSNLTSYSKLASYCNYNLNLTLECSSLKELKLSSCSLKEHILKMFLLANFKNLEILDLDYVYELSEFFDNFLNEEVLNGSKLKYFYVEKCFLNSNNFNTILKMCPLIEFYCKNFDRITVDFNIFDLSENSKSNYRILHGSEVNEESLQNISSINTLETLTLVRIDVKDHSIVECFSKFKKIKKIDLNGVDFYGKIPALKNSNESLKTLILNDCSLYVEEIARILEVFNKIEDLAINEASIKNLYKSKNLTLLSTSLKKLDLANCDGSNEDFIELIKKFSNLKLLRISYSIDNKNLENELKLNEWFELDITEKKPSNWSSTDPYNHWMSKYQNLDIKKNRDSSNLQK